MSKITEQKTQIVAEAEITAMQIILLASLMIGTSIALLPKQSVNGYQVPIFIFSDHPSIFHAFVICIIFSFSGSFCYLIIEKKLRFKLAQFCRYCSVMSMAMALSILAYALFLDGIMCVFLPGKGIRSG